MVRRDRTPSASVAIASEVVRCAGSHPEQCVLEANPRRRGVPLHAILQVAHALDDGTVVLDQGSLAVDGDVDGRGLGARASRAVSCADRGLVSKCRRGGEQHGRPGALHPGQLTGVFDEDPVMDAGQLAPPHHPAYVVGCQPSREQLAAGDDPALQLHQPSHLVSHPRMLEEARRSGNRASCGLWTAPCAAVTCHLVARDRGVGADG